MQAGGAPPNSRSSAPATNVARDANEPPPAGQRMVSGDMASPDRRGSLIDDLRGQLTESGRLRLKIEEQLVSAAEPGAALESMKIKVRARLEEINRELEPAEQALSSLLQAVTQSGIADPQIQTLNDIDGRLAKVLEVHPTGVGNRYHDDAA